jgi:hypothetical protein
MFNPGLRPVYAEEKTKEKDGKNSADPVKIPG